MVALVLVFSGHGARLEVSDECHVHANRTDMETVSATPGLDRRNNIIDPDAYEGYLSERADFFAEKVKSAATGEAPMYEVKANDFKKKLDAYKKIRANKARVVNRPTAKKGPGCCCLGEFVQVVGCPGVAVVNKTACFINQYQITSCEDMEEWGLAYTLGTHQCLTALGHYELPYYSNGCSGHVGQLRKQKQRRKDGGFEDKPFIRNLS